MIANDAGRGRSQDLSRPRVYKAMTHRTGEAMTTTAQADIEQHAQQFGWERYPGQPREQIYLRGATRIFVQFRRDGTVELGLKYHGASLKPGSQRLTGQTPPKFKKSTIIAWLAGAS